MTSLTEEVRGKVRKRKDRIRREKEERSWEERPERAPAAHTGVALDARAVALYSVLLGEFEQASEWLGSAAEHYHASGASRLEVNVDLLSTLRNAPHQLVTGLYMAVLAGDESVIREIADTILEMDREHSYQLHDGSFTTVDLDADDYHHARCLAAIAIDDRERAADRLERLQEAIGDQPEGASAEHFARNAAVVDGILDPDPDRITSAIREELAHHERELPGDPEISEDLICVEATAMLVLARRAGLAVEVDSEFVPTDYVEWLLPEPPE